VESQRARDRGKKDRRKKEKDRGERQKDREIGKDGRK
jgi:hypothetical protein